MGRIEREGSGRARSKAPRLFVNGANLHLQTAEFQQDIGKLLEETARLTTLVGPYDQTDLARRMATVDWVVIPSTWWENSPLVIQEAFMCGRPVICSDIGGMAENVKNGVNSLHFKANDPANLAATLRYAVETPGLWEKLRAGIPKVYRVDEAVVKLGEIYSDLLETRLTI
jgi:glycosyltransferase involved in cell wall biosynthesis